MQSIYRILQRKIYRHTQCAPANVMSPCLLTPDPCPLFSVTLLLHKKTGIDRYTFADFEKILSVTGDGGVSPYWFVKLFAT